MSRATIENEILERTGKHLKEILIELYFEKGLSQRKISKELGLSTGYICERFKEYKIDKKPLGYFRIGAKISEEHREIIIKTHKGKKLSVEHKKRLSDFRTGRKMVGKNPKWTGKKHRKDGYIQIRKPEHPFCCKDGYIFEHRLVMEQKIGRNLKREESIHHINRVKNDNRSENLFLFATNGDHSYFHMMERLGKNIELKYKYENKGSFLK